MGVPPPFHDRSGAIAGGFTRLLGGHCRLHLLVVSGGQRGADGAGLPCNSRDLRRPCPRDRPGRRAGASEAIHPASATLRPWGEGLADPRSMTAICTWAGRRPGTARLINPLILLLPLHNYNMVYHDIPLPKARYSTDRQDYGREEAPSISPYGLLLDGSRGGYSRSSGSMRPF